MTLANRVQFLVDLQFKGSVNGAAKEWGISQSQLYRIVSGETLNPRTGVLVAIVRGARECLTVESLIGDVTPEMLEDDQ